jgi:hypothetical protein
MSGDSWRSEPPLASRGSPLNLRHWPRKHQNSQQMDSYSEAATNSVSKESEGKSVCVRAWR